MTRGEAIVFIAFVFVFFSLLAAGADYWEWRRHDRERRRERLVRRNLARWHS